MSSVWSNQRVADEVANASWRAHDQSVHHLDQRFSGLYQRKTFAYQQPLRLQQGVPARLRKPYTVPVAYTDWGPPDAPLLVCMGGVANTAMRFCFLAADLCRDQRIICMDWLGRGHSGWLADDSEYSQATYVEQLRQLLAHLRSSTDAHSGGSPSKRRPVTLLGSSMGGSVAIDFIAQQSRQVQGLVLCDVGPSIPRARRRRRGQTVARFYVFRSPAELSRRVGAAQKNDGPVRDEVRRFIAHHQTQYSAEHGGRIYSHDLRALIAYRREAQQDVNQWQAWDQVHCPVLLLHGMESDALSLRTIARMHQGHPALTVAHIPHTGHTPVLSDRHQTQLVQHWLRRESWLEPGCESSLLLAPHRQPWTNAAVQGFKRSA